MINTWRSWRYWAFMRSGENGWAINALSSWRGSFLIVSDNEMMYLKNNSNNISKSAWQLNRWKFYHSFFLILPEDTSHVEQVLRHVWNVEHHWCVRFHTSQKTTVSCVHYQFKTWKNKFLKFINRKLTHWFLFFLDFFFSKSCQSFYH